MSTLHVEMIPEPLPPDSGELQAAAERLEQAQHTGNVTDIRAAQDAYAAAQESGKSWLARIDGVTFPVVGYVASNDEETGEMILSLMLAPTSMSIADAPAAAGTPASAALAETKAQVRTWGDPGLPDPRASIPGWAPVSTSVTSLNSGHLGAFVEQPIGRQVAVHGEQSMRLGTLRGGPEVDA